MKWSVVGYALLCVVAPLAWGLVVVWASNLIERRLRRPKDDGASQEIPPIDYHI